MYEIETGSTGNEPEMLQKTRDFEPISNLVTLCSAGVTEKMIAFDGGTEMLKTLFKGIVINKQVYLDTSTGSTGGSTLNTNEDRAIFPIIKTHVEAASNGHKPEIAFFGIGYDYVYRNHL